MPKSNLGFYRKYRPQKFVDVIGQQIIIDLLKEQIKRNQAHYAYLFAGLHGTGKTSTARIFAKTINCKNLTAEGEACDQCSSCQITIVNHPDIIEIDAASNNGVDQIRSLRAQTFSAPLSGDRKIYIVDEVHMLSASAYNAFLKLLEEPPRHVIFILATTEMTKIPATILSRCQIFRFTPLSAENLKTVLQKIAHQEQITIKAEALQAIAQKAGGSVRDAINIFEQIALLNQGQELTSQHLYSQLGGPKPDSILQLLDGIIHNRPSQIFEQLSYLTKNNNNFARLNGAIMAEINSVLLARFAQSEKKNIHNFTAQWPTTSLQLILRNLAEYFIPPSLEISIETAFQILIWKILEQLHSSKNLAAQPSTKQPPTNKPPTKEILEKPPVFSRDDFLATAKSLIAHRDRENSQYVHAQWRNLSNYIGEMTHNSFIKVLLVCRPVVATSSAILLVTEQENIVEQIDHWKNNRPFQKFIETVFQKSFSFFTVTANQLKLIKKEVTS